MSFLEVQGLEGLQKALQELPEKLEQRVVTRALNKGADLIREEAIRQVPVKSGWLRESIQKGVVSRKKLKDGEFGVRVGLARVKKSQEPAPKAIRRSISIRGKTFTARKGWRPGPHVYGRFVHFKRKGYAGNPFLERAAESRAQAAVDLITKTLAEEIQKAAKKLRSNPK